MFGFREKKDPWRGGVYLTTAKSTFEADILESKLAAENIACMRRYEGASNFLEITMGLSTVFPVEIYVPGDLLLKAQKVIEPVPIEDDFIESDDWYDEAMAALEAAEKEAEAVMEQAAKAAEEAEAAGTDADEAGDAEKPEAADAPAAETFEEKSGEE